MNNRTISLKLKNELANDSLPLKSIRYCRTMEDRENSKNSEKVQKPGHISFISYNQSQKSNCDIFTEHSRRIEVITFITC